MKLFKRKNFQSLIYAIFISLPILSLLPNLLYFGFNEKASDYTDVNVVETYEYETNEVNSVDDLVVGNIYKCTFNPQNTANGGFMQVWGAYKIPSYNGEVSFDTHRDTVLTLGYDTSNNAITLRASSENRVLAYLETENVIEFYVVYNLLINNYSYSRLSASDYLGEKNVEVIESEMNPQNAFEYTISKFIKDNNFGRIDFFSFFSSLFLGNATINAVYVGFVNWYLNYILYVSLAYLLFSVLLWFVNFARKLLEDSQNINIGGF